MPDAKGKLTTDNGAIVSPPMYWSVLPGPPYAMRYSTGINSLMHERVRRIRQQLLKAKVAQEVAAEEQASHDG